jgi:hypothetical protein
MLRVIRRQLKLGFVASFSTAPLPEVAMKNLLQDRLNASYVNVDDVSGQVATHLVVGWSFHSLIVTPLA